MDSSRCLGAWSLRQGDHPLLLISSSFTSRVWLEDSDSYETGLLSRLDHIINNWGRQFLAEWARPLLWPLWDSWLPDRRGRQDRLTSETGAAEGGGLFTARCCIRWALFSFIILICLVIPCISRWRPFRSGACLVLAIEWALLSKGLLALGLGNKRLRRSIES